VNLFAGSHGYVYQLDPKSGKVIYTNNLSSLGLNEVRLATDGVRLYCGSNNHVVALGLDRH
jgi:outer membrane protein assembly factor BamB